MKTQTMLNKQNKTTIDLIRHGDTLSGPACFLGSTDSPLSESGWLKMQFAVKPDDYQRIITSPLKRCVEFSHALADESKLPMRIENDLREIHFGDWDGVKIKKIWEEYPDQLSAFWNEPLNNTPPNAESLMVFQNRVNHVFKKIKQQYVNEHILLITHGGVIRQILANILSIEFKTTQQINIDYAGLTRVECDRENCQIAFVNQLQEK